MDPSMSSLLLSAAGMLLGGSVGYLFGTVQNNALRNYEGRRKQGTSSGGWSAVPGSMRRTALLLALLAALQILCPAFFDGGNVQWLVSAGVVLGYGWTLARQQRGRAVHRV